MDSNHITVVYKWTAQAGKLDELTSIYAGVTDAMHVAGATGMRQRVLDERHLFGRAFAVAAAEVGFAIDQDRRVGPALIDPLTDREIEVLEKLTTQLTYQEIADELYVSPNTVKSHTAAIYRKLAVARRTAAVDRARELGLLAV